jgi:PIN domain nuclease of toxin-antitoxin system
MSAVLDASSVLAYLFNERGADTVTAVMASGSIISTANLSEVMAVLVRDGMAASDATAIIADLPVDVFDLTLDLALSAGAMIALTRPAGLSLGDRVCLALAKRERLPAVTADAVWATIADAVGVSVQLVR